MAKEWRFYDSSGTLRKVKGAYFYDSAGNLKEIKEGYFYDSAGNRRIFYEGGLAPPAAGYFPNSNFTMQVGENAINTGFLGGSYGEVAPDGLSPGDFPLYPTTDATAHLAQMFYAYRNKSTSVFEMYYYRNPFPNPAADTKFWGLNVLNQTGGLYTSLPRSTSTETVNANDILHRWSYIMPLTVGSIYQFIFRERAVNTTMVAGQLNEVTGFASGAGGEFGANAFGSMANQMFTTRVGWNVVTLATHGFDEYLILEVQGPSGATDPGAGFICQLATGTAGIGNKPAAEASYSWNGSLRIAKWIWEESAIFANGVQTTVQLG